jgi:hypothetical protein
LGGKQVVWALHWIILLCQSFGPDWFKNTNKRHKKMLIVEAASIPGPPIATGAQFRVFTNNRQPVAPSNAWHILMKRFFKKLLYPKLT